MFKNIQTIYHYTIGIAQLSLVLSYNKSLQLLYFQYTKYSLSTKFILQLLKITFLSQHSG